MEAMSPSARRAGRHCAFPKPTSCQKARPRAGIRSTAFASHLGKGPRETRTWRRASCGRSRRRCCWCAMTTAATRPLCSRLSLCTRNGSAATTSTVGCWRARMSRPVCSRKAGSLFCPTTRTSPLPNGPPWRASSPRAVSSWSTTSCPRGWNRCSACARPAGLRETSPPGHLPTPRSRACRRKCNRPPGISPTP